MRAPRNFKPDRCYHLISRIANRAFCLTEEERSRFVERLWRVAKFSGCEVPAYCRSVHTGTTWESRFRTREYRSDEKCALLNAAVYIDRNPVKVKMSSWPERYEWCSFATVDVSSCGQGKEIGIVSYSTTLTPPLGSYNTPPIENRDGDCESSLGSLVVWAQTEERASTSIDDDWS